MNLTVAYVTARRDPKIEWFWDSLNNQLQEQYKRESPNWSGRTSVIVILPHTVEEPFWGAQAFTQSIYHKPKPTVWQGEHRLTKEDWWAMSNARNTALCLCQTTHIAYVDDLSVLLPGWLDAVKEAMAGNYIGCGAYRKVKKLEVENGEVKSFEVFSDDCRLQLAPETVGACTGDWLYGCSCVFPVDALLTVGGWPEYVDGLGAEDYTLGIALGNAGYHLKYDKRMMTYESEEHHHDGVQMKKKDKGTSPDDKSHAALRIAKQSKHFPNYYPGGMRALRDYVLAGNPFPVIQEPKHDWYDGMLISEME